MLCYCFKSSITISGTPDVSNFINKRSRSETIGEEIEVVVIVLVGKVTSSVPHRLPKLCRTNYCGKTNYFYLC